MVWDWVHRFLSEYSRDVMMIASLSPMTTGLFLPSKTSTPRPELQRYPTVPSGVDTVHFGTVGASTTAMNHRSVFFRDTEVFLKLGHWAAEHSQEGNLGGIYSFGSSDGSEAYSLLTAIFADLPEDAQKKLPTIQAYDIDPMVVHKAQQGWIYISRDDIYHLKTFRPRDGRIRRKYGQLLNTMKQAFFNSFLLDPNNPEATERPVPQRLLRKVDFQQGDFKQMIQSPAFRKAHQDGRPVVVMARNFWYHLVKNQPKDKALQTLSNTIGDLKSALPLGSLVVIGQVEIHPGKYYPPGFNLGSLLQHNGFERYEDDPYIYQLTDPA